jgi:alanine racemase
MTLRPTWMEVRLDHIKANCRAIRKHIGGSKTGGAAPRVFGVIKANAYNLGAVPVAWALREEGVDFFMVATPDEALELRSGGITDPILVLGASPYDAAPEYVRYGIRASITDMEMARAMSAASARLGRRACVHIKIDTGLGRIGFSPDDALETISRVASLPGVACEGVFTHFATADGADLTYAREQHASFLAVLERIGKRGLHIPMRHCCNSGATLSFPEWCMEGVRPGQLLAGIYPTDDVPRTVPILPGFYFKTAVAALRVLPPGQGVGYGLTYTTKSEERLAVLPVGFVDGFARGLSNNADVLIRGIRCPVAGRICMDQCMVNVSAVSDVKIGDEVILIGRQGNEEITIYEYARKLGTIPVTIGPMIGNRVPRLYLNGNPDDIGNPFFSDISEALQ